MVVVSPTFTDAVAGWNPSCALLPAWGGGADGSGGAEANPPAGAGAAPNGVDDGADGAAEGAPPGAPNGAEGDITIDSRRISGFVSVPDARLRRFSAVMPGMRMTWGITTIRTSVSSFCVLLSAPK